MYTSPSRFTVLLEVSEVIKPHSTCWYSVEVVAIPSHNNTHNTEERYTLTTPKKDIGEFHNKTA